MDSQQVDFVSPKTFASYSEKLDVMNCKLFSSFYCTSYMDTPFINILVTILDTTQLTILVPLFAFFVFDFFYFVTDISVFREMATPRGLDMEMNEGERRIVNPFRLKTLRWLKMERKSNLVHR